MVPFRGLDAEGDFPADLAEFFPDGFHLLRGGHFIHCRPARRNKQEDAPHARLHFFHQLYKVVELTQRAPGNGGVDLEVHARLLGHFRRAKGPFIRVRARPGRRHAWLHGRRPGSGTCFAPPLLSTHENPHAPTWPWRQGSRPHAAPCPPAARISSRISGLMMGSPPVSTSMGGRSSASRSMSRKASSWFSSSGCGRGWATALQCLHARAQARVTSQKTRKGRSLRSVSLKVGRIPQDCHFRTIIIFDQPKRRHFPKMATWPLLPEFSELPWAVRRGISWNPSGSAWHWEKA